MIQSSVVNMAMLKMVRIDLKTTLEIVTGHSKLNIHLSIIRFSDTSLCLWCVMAEKTHHILCECPIIHRYRFRHYGTMQLDIVTHLAFSANLAPGNYYLFTSLKEHLSGRPSDDEEVRNRLSKQVGDFYSLVTTLVSSSYLRDSKIKSCEVVESCIFLIIYFRFF